MGACYLFERTKERQKAAGGNGYMFERTKTCKREEGKPDQLAQA